MLATTPATPKTPTGRTPNGSTNPDGGNTGTTPGNGGGSSTGNPGGNPTTPNPGQGGNGSTPNPGDGGSTPQPTTVPPPTCPACPIPTEKPCPVAEACPACPTHAPQSCPAAPTCPPPAPAPTCKACPAPVTCPAVATCPPAPQCPACPKPTEKVCPTSAPCPTTTPTPKKPTCDAGWKYYADTKSCYAIGLEKLTNMDAQKSCIKYAAKLASIHSEAENMFLYDWINGTAGNTGNLNAWIGLYRTGLGANGFAHFDGTPIDYTRWAKGEPSNWGGDEACVELLPLEHMKYNSTTQWNDIKCDNPRPAYICKKPANL